MFTVSYCSPTAFASVLALSSASTNEPGHEISNNAVCGTSKNSEYDQEIPQSQTADNPVALRGRAAQPPQDTM